MRTPPLTPGSPIAQRYPRVGETHTRPWGLISTHEHRVRYDPTDSTRTKRLPRRRQFHIATLTGPGIDTDMLQSQDWVLALRDIRNDHGGPIAAAGISTLVVLGGIAAIIPTHTLASSLALTLAVPILVCAAAIIARRWDMRRTQAARARVFTDDQHSVAIIRLDPEAPMTTLIQSLDALATAHQRHQIDDPTWQRARELACAAAEDVALGLRDGTTSETLETATQFIHAARKDRQRTPTVPAGGAGN
ncbi:hypothetical protein [Brachybacterium huguangmaarense]